MLQNSVAGFSRTVQSDATGHYTFSNVPFNPYHLYVSSPGFTTQDQRLTLRTSVPTVLTNTLAVASAGSEVTVEAGGELVENSSTFHVDIEREQFAKLPLESVSSSVSSLLTLESPGVSADSNGLFHGLGDHAENAFYIDGQPVTDQQSKVFSNQIPEGAIQSLEVISGAPPAEYGEKTSLVANITTRSGQGITTPRGELVASYGTFGTADVSADLAAGTQRLGNFTALELLNTGRFLDPSEFAVMHARGNSENFFDRVDSNFRKQDALHTDFQFTRSWFQTPNAYENLDLTSASGTVLGNTDQRTQDPDRLNRAFPHPHHLRASRSPRWARLYAATASTITPPATRCWTSPRSSLKPSRSRARCSTPARGWTTTTSRATTTSSSASPTSRRC